MNKYIGESEKNLGRLLDEAAALDVILLIDEADALFGRRGEGKETGERYANMLTNFLLTRIEQHPGIVILTSNNRGRIDAAFTRRFDAIIEFPPPGAAERLRIWQAHLGRRAPDAALCRQLASYCTLPGGYIRNAVLQAAALDPADGGDPAPIAAERLVAALIEEYRKIGRSPPPQLLHARGTS
ncbi:ATP-binding protein [Thauera sp. SDU_THAU2]|uniref:ATP-binding protein n=1 Tax=Thauera sp. SDU_THAU2 TaxID=3136633 RepID=UPI00311D5B47